jgi:hypothetical protein
MPLAYSNLKLSSEIQIVKSESTILLRDGLTLEMAKAF